MADPKLLDYLRQQLSAGVPEDQVRAALAGGQWSDQEVNGAFGLARLEVLQQANLAGAVPVATPNPVPAPAAPAPTAAPMPASPAPTASVPAAALPVGPRPRSLKIFEVLMYLSIATSIGAMAIAYGSILTLGPSTLLVLIYPAGLILVLVAITYVAAHRRANWARGLAAAIFGYSAIQIMASGSLFTILYSFQNLQLGATFFLTAFTVLLQAIAMFFLFSKETALWYTGGAQAPAVPTGPTTKSLWEKTIPLTNLLFLVVVLIFVCGIDLSILVSSPSLFGYWAEMAVVLVLFLLFFWRENFMLSKAFRTTSSSQDGWIYALIGVRNVVFLLNSIPFIQILGGFVLLYGFIPYVVLYFMAINMRKRVTPAVPA